MLVSSRLVLADSSGALSIDAAIAALPDVPKDDFRRWDFVDAQDEGLQADRGRLTACRTCVVEQESAAGCDYAWVSFSPTRTTAIMPLA